MNILTKMRNALRRFARDTTGSYAIETALVVPMLLWGTLATYTYVDAYRMQSMNLRATYTISDLLTRQWNPVDRPFMVGMGRFHEFLTNDSHPTAMRVTVIYYDEPNDKHVLVWSWATDNAPGVLVAADVTDMKDSIPALANADTAIIVETWMNYNPPFSIGLGAQQFSNRVISSPRFVPQLLWNDAPATS